MSTNLKTYIILFLSVLSLKSYSQHCIAGVPGAVYVDIVPDAFLSAPSGSPQNYYIDLDQNGTYDVRFKSDIWTFPVESGASVQASAQRSDVKISYGWLDSSLFHICSPDPNAATYWHVVGILDRYNYLDSINSNHFKSGGSAYLGYRYYVCGNLADNGLWINSGDKYIGVSMTDSASMTIRYGWVKVNVTGYSSSWIKEYSLSAPVPIGISEADVEQSIVVSPNPASDKINISAQKENTVVHLTDLSGRELKTISTNKDHNTEIDVADLPAGIYFLRIQSKDTFRNVKIVVQH